MNAWLADTFAALAVRDFRVLWVGTLFSFFAFFMSTVVNSVVAFELTGANQAVGLVVAGQGLAMFLLGPIGGAYADRLPKRRVIASGQLLAASVFAVIGLLVATEAIQVGFLALGSLAMGATFAFLGPARQALAVEVVGAEQRGNAVALSQVANNAARVVGPAAAGIFLAWPLFGATGAYFVMASFYTVSASLLLLLPRSVVRANVGETHVLQDLMAGVRYVREEEQLGLMVLLLMLPIMLGFPYVTVLPGFVENQLGRSAQLIGWLHGTAAVGGLATGLLVARYADSDQGPRIVVLLGFGFGATLVLLSFAPSFALAVAVMLLLGATSGGFQTLSGAVVMRQADPIYAGRVMSLTLLAFGGFGLGGLPVGMLADALGERASMLTLGVVVCGVVALLGWRLAKVEARLKAAEPATEG